MFQDFPKNVILTLYNFLHIFKNDDKKMFMSSKFVTPSLSIEAPKKAGQLIKKRQNYSYIYIYKHFIPIQLNICRFLSCVGYKIFELADCIVK